jgi:hypothetical protein
MPITIKNSAGGGVTLDSTTSSNETLQLPSGGGTLAVLPTGLILMWSGAAAAIPSGWVICDGNNSTPNLTDKFIKSAAAAGATGGSATTGAHTLSTAEMPAHTHQIFNRGTYRGQANQTWITFARGDAGNTEPTTSVGGGGSHTHSQSEPIHFALIFIMKT